MIPTLTKIAVALVLASTPVTPRAFQCSHSCSVARPSTSRRQRTDSTTIGEPAPVLLTEELLKNYEAVRADLAAFWQAHPALKDSARATVVASRVTFTGPSPIPSKTDTVCEFGYTELATKTPVIASIFTTHHLPGTEYLPVTVALWKGLYVVQIDAALDAKVPDDTTNIAGKNITILKSHVPDLDAVKIRWHFKREAGGAAGGGGDDLNP